jgi:hypothetical protein
LLCGETVVPLVAVSGAECVEALLLAGFALQSRSDSATTLERELRVVVVPDVAMLVPEDLEALLRDAGISYDVFLDLLSEMPTDPDVLAHSTSGIRRPSA